MTRPNKPTPVYWVPLPHACMGIVDRPANRLGGNGYNGQVFILDCIWLGRNGLTKLLDWCGLDFVESGLDRSGFRSYTFGSKIGSTHGISLDRLQILRLDGTFIFLMSTEMPETRPRHASSLIRAWMPCAIFRAPFNHEVVRGPHIKKLREQGGGASVGDLRWRQVQAAVVRRRTHFPYGCNQVITPGIRWLLKEGHHRSQRPLAQRWGWGLLSERSGNEGSYSIGCSGNLDPDKPWHVQMLEKEYIEWNVPQHLRATNDLVAGGVLISYTTDKEDGESGEGESADLINGKMSFVIDSEDKSDGILCSFLLVDSLATAESYQSCSLKVHHKNIAKVYSIGYNRSLCKYFVCYERLNPFSKAQEDRIDHQQSGRRKQQKPKLRWRKNIREIFEALEALHLAGYGNNSMNETTNFAYGQGNDQDKLLKIICGGPLPCDDARTKKSQRVRFCTFLEQIGAENTVEYKAFKVLVQHSDDVKVIMKHPYILASDKETVAAIGPLNERLYDLAESKRVDLNTSLEQNFRGWVWQSMVKKSAKFSVFLSSNKINWDDYDGSLVSLIDYTAVNKAIEEVFLGFISWAYTYSYLFVI
uniref:Uncharacterized protein n=1 Tax=Oryza punctata TaxID=4537 RepID=A0A0E0JW30_ORYPU